MPVCIVLAAIAFASNSLLVQAAQITPNPNPLGSTIDIINDPFAENAANPFVNAGTISIDDLSTLTNIGILNNNSSGLVDGNGRFINSGMLSNFGSIYSRFTNSGMMTNFGGFSGGVTNNGTFINNANWHDNIFINNTGTWINNGNLLETGGAFVNSGTLTNNSRLDIDTSGLDNNGTMINAGVIGSFSGSIVSNTGTLINEVGGTLTNMDGRLGNTGTLTNFGTVNNGYKLTNDVGGVLTNFGVLINQVGFPDGALTNKGTLSNFGALGNTSTLINTGTLINAGSVNSLGMGGGLIQNSGTVFNSGTIEQAAYLQTAGQTVNNGILTASVDVQGGSLRGTGIINGPVTIDSGAILSPGTATTLGTLTINGNLQSSGDLLFRLGGVGVGQFDVLAIHGMAFLNGGTIGVNFMNFTPVAGNSWDFLYASVISGLETIRFNLSGLSPNLGYAFTYANGVETLRVYSVPEPSSFSILLGGLMILAGARWLSFRRERLQLR